MNPVFLSLSTLLVFTPVAEAASWHKLQSNVKMTLQAGNPQLETVDKSETEVEKKKDRKLNIWDKITYSRPQQAMPGDFYFAAAKSLTEINCTARTLKLLQRVYYDSDDNEIKSIHYGEKERSEAVAPDTSGEAIFNFACTSNKTAAVTPKATPRPESTASASKPVTDKEKAKETQKSEPPAGTKSSSPASPAPPAAKPADTKKAAH